MDVSDKYIFSDNKERILRGKKAWEKVSNELNVDNNTVILVLANDDNELDNEALKHLPNFVKRKRARCAAILVPADMIKKRVLEFSYSFPTTISIVNREVLIQIYDYYCFAFNLDNIAFTFIEQCSYNTLGRLLEETDITAEEAACLGVYWLRELQGKMPNV